MPSLKPSTPFALRNNVHISGNGTQPLLFAHGFGRDQNMWRYISPAFDNDFKIIVPTPGLPKLAYNYKSW